METDPWSPSSYLKVEARVTNPVHTPTGVKPSTSSNHAHESNPGSVTVTFLYPHPTHTKCSSSSYSFLYHEVPSIQDSINCVAWLMGFVLVSPNCCFQFSLPCTPGSLDIWSFVDVEKDPLVVLVTGAAGSTSFSGQIGYALVPMIAGGAMLGPNQPVILHLLDIEPASEILKGVKMELMDGAFPLLKDVIATTDVIEACRGVDIAIMLGGFPRRKGDGKDLIFKNAGIYKAQASALDQYADPNCKVLVVANPANTNALILKEYAPSIPEENITSLTRLDHNRALSQISENLNVHVGDVRNAIIWGNNSSNLYPDANHATVDIGAGHKPVKELIADDQWLKSKFITNVEQRGQAIINARRLSSAFSTASAACDHIRDWILGTPKGTWVSMGVYSDGSHGIQPGLIYSFPVTCKKGEWSIVQGLKIDEFSREKMDAVESELIEEKTMAYSCLH